MSGCLGQFMKHSGVLTTVKFAYRMRLGTCNAFLRVSHSFQSALESGQELGLCSTAFDRVNR